MIQLSVSNAEAIGIEWNFFKNFISCKEAFQFLYPPGMQEGCRFVGTFTVVDATGAEVRQEIFRSEWCKFVQVKIQGRSPKGYLVYLDSQETTFFLKNLDMYETAPGQYSYFFFDDQTNLHGELTLKLEACP